MHEIDYEDRPASLAAGITGRPGAAMDRPVREIAEGGWDSDDVQDDLPRAVHQYSDDGHVVTAGSARVVQRQDLADGRSPMCRELLDGEAALAYDRASPGRVIGRPGWLGTVTRRHVSGLYRISWLPYAWRSKTKPALRRTRITSLAVREGAWVMGRR